MKRFLCFLIAVLLTVPLYGQPETLTNDSIIKMVKVGLATDLIVGKIEEATQVQFDLSIEGMVSLKEANVPDEVIRSMKAKQQNVAPAATTPQPVTPTVPTISAGAAQQFEEAQYLVKAPGQEKAQAVKGTLMFDPTAKAIRFTANGTTQVDIPYQSITGLLYEKTAKPRYGWGLLVSWPLLFTKSKSHYFTVQYKGPNGTGEFAIVRLHKKNYQMALATAEAQTGIKVEREQEH